MCPSLARENYFLDVINNIHSHQVENGSLEQELQLLLLDLAEMVRTMQEITPVLLQSMNRLFAQYQAVRLKVSKIPREKNTSALLLHTEFIDEDNQLKRVYMEAMISLLEALEKGQLELQTCMQCGNWFIPYQRAQVTKFCSSKCRNRHHYELRKIGQQEKMI